MCVHMYSAYMEVREQRVRISFLLVQVEWVPGKLWLLSLDGFKKKKCLYMLSHQAGPSWINSKSIFKQVHIYLCYS